MQLFILGGCVATPGLQGGYYVKQCTECSTYINCYLTLAIAKQKSMLLGQLVCCKYTCILMHLKQWPSNHLVHHLYNPIAKVKLR